MYSKNVKMREKLGITWVLFLMTFMVNGQSFYLSKLKVEQQTYPTGILKSQPRFSWVIGSTASNFLQSAYQIQVASDSIHLLNSKQLTWDSKKVIDGASQWRTYQGATLKSACTYYWRVKIWDRNGKPSSWSAIHHFQMGLASKADWSGAQWITDEILSDSLVTVPLEHGRGEKARALKKNHLPLFRKEIQVQQSLKRATLFMAGLGQFDLFVNGKKATDHFCDQAWTLFSEEVQYLTVDITSQLQKGSNAIGVMLGNGYFYIPAERYRKMSGAYGYPKMIAKVLLEYADGSTAISVSDNTWKTSKGPIIFSSVYGGEDYDARLEQVGWNRVGFDDQIWSPVKITHHLARLQPQMAAPLKVMDTLQSLKNWSVLSGTGTVYDLGQNASGIPLIEVKGNRGDTIKILPGELLNEKGEVSQRATGGPVYYQYILKDSNIAQWHPQFSFYGFRYLQITTFPAQGERPQVIKVTGLHTRNAADSVGSFQCSLPLFNQTKDLILWAIKSNMASVLMDCPHREKLGWMEQQYLMGNSIRYNFDVLHFFRKTLHDLSLEQTATGKLPEFAPEYVKMDFMEGIFRESPEWGSTAVILPWYLYQWYGDQQLLKDHYQLMQKYTQYLGLRSSNGMVSFGLSDWYDVGPNRSGLTQQTPMGLTATATYYYDLTIMQQVAKILGDRVGENKYLQEAVKVKKAFHDNFYDAKKYWYGTGSQTAQAMALYMQLVPDSLRSAVLKKLIMDLEERNFALTTGDIGYRYLLKVLETSGRSDLIFKMNARVDVPGYGYQLAKGATALTESWMASPLVSNNHLMLGHLMEWFYGGLVGIQQDKGSVGYQKILFKPHPVGDIREAQATHESSYGTIKASWKSSQNKFEFNLEVPPNTIATVELPFKKWTSLWLDHQKISLDDLKSLGSGSHQIIVQL